MRPGRAERGALCTFHRHVWRFCLHLPWPSVRTVSLSAILDWSPLLQVVRSGVGVILTSPSLLVEGVRSGSRRRNAATASPLAGGGAEPESRRAAPARGGAAL